MATTLGIIIVWDIFNPLDVSGVDSIHIFTVIILTDISSFLIFSSDTKGESLINPKINKSEEKLRSNSSEMNDKVIQGHCIGSQPMWRKTQLNASMSENLRNLVFIGWDLTTHAKCSECMTHWIQGSFLCMAYPSLTPMKVKTQYVWKQKFTPLQYQVVVSSVGNHFLFFIVVLIITTPLSTR
jgi:hypothetical protein